MFELCMILIFEEVILCYGQCYFMRVCYHMTSVNAVIYVFTLYLLYKYFDSWVPVD